VGSLALVAALLLAPHELATVRGAGVSLAWWGTLGALAVGVAVLVMGTAE
jgi:hypothetical protein